MNKYIIPTLYRWNDLGIKSHQLPNAIGMWHNEMECMLWCALNSPEGDWLEIGAFCGGSVTLLAIARDEANLGPSVYTCDIEFKPIVNYNIINSCVSHLIIPIQCNSHTLYQQKELQDSQLGFAFIDGYHSYSGIIHDVNAILPFLQIGTILGFHDVSPKTYGYNAIEYLKSIKPTKERHNQLMADLSENFLLDEAISYLLNYTDGMFELVDIPVRTNETHFKETKLTEWVRGTTSPFNSYVALRKIK